MKYQNSFKMGAIILFAGFILVLLSIQYSYPIQIGEINEKTFDQFHPTLWLGIIFLTIGTFIIGYLGKNKIIKVICSSIIPIIFYAYVYFFTYVPSSDCGNVRSMFLIFNEVGINADFVPYFQYPSYFIINQITFELTGINVNGISFVYFTLYGVLIGLFLYLLYTNISNDNYKKYAFVFVLIYFIGIYSFLNFQWVPQTLALVFMVILIYISSFIYRFKKFEYKILLLLVFITIIFTHAFLPVIFIIFFGLLMLKNNSLRSTFIILLSADAIVMIYFTTVYFPYFIETLQQSLSGFSGEYTSRITQSFQPPEEFLSKLISNINRFRVPITWAVVGLGSFFMFIKRKMENFVFLLGLAGGLYLAVGMMFSVMGMRSIQIVLIPITIGFGYLLTKYKKPTIAFLMVILLLVVFGPMRETYDITYFHTDEEANSCVFLADNVNPSFTSEVATNQVNFGYFKNLYRYHTYHIPEVYRSGNPFFYEVFNKTMKTHNYVIYNQNLGKEILEHGFRGEQLDELLRDGLFNNKIYSSKNTFILNGIY
jgi:hypothetical protein